MKRLFLRLKQLLGIKIIVFLDMDGVLADFDGAITSGVTNDPPEMFEAGFFRKLKVHEGAKDAVEALLANPNLRVYIGSKPTYKNPLCATEKFQWIIEHFPALKKRIVLACNKELLQGDVLVDDDFERWAHKFHGHFIHFDRTNPKKSWEAVVAELCK